MPFDASKDVLDHAFGAGNYRLSEYKELNGTTLIFSPMENPSVVAGKPYMIKVISDVISPQFLNVTMKYTTEQQTIANAKIKIVLPFLSKALWNFNNHYVYFVNAGSTAKVGYGTGELQKDLVAPKGYIETDGTVAPQVNANNGAREQLSNVPTVYIDIPDVTNIDTDLTKDRSTGEAELYHRATIQVVATTDKSSPYYLESFSDDHLQIKVRGNATADPSKRAYRLKFDKKDEVTGQNYKHDLLGKGYSKRNWILKASAFDYSMLRDPLMSELGELVGMDFVPGYKHVDLVINGDYRGTYIVSDHAEVGSNRIPVDETTGWYVEFQGRGDMLDPPMCFTDPLQMNVKNPEPDDDTDETQRNAILQPIQDWFKNTWNYQIWGWDDSSFLNAQKDWRELNDEDSWLKFILITELTADYDGYMTVKAYREADGKLCLGPIWDKDLAFGNITCAQDNSMVADIQNGSFRWYVHKLYLDKEFINHLRVLFKKLVDEGLQQKLNEKIDLLSERIKETWAANFERWTFIAPDGSMQVFKEWTDQDSYNNQLKEWIATRIAFLQEQYTTMSQAAGWMDITLDEPVVHAQLTDVPTIYITSSGMNADTWDATASMEVFDSNNMIGGDKTYGAGAVSVKFKGDGTSQKPSYRLKFGSKTAFLGTKSGSYKQWVLEANDDDPTMLRNALTEELADQMGFAFTPGCQYADVYVNDKYMGTYQITDRIKVESGRVLAANKDTDWLVEIASKGEVDMRTDGYGDLYVEGTTEQPYIIIKNPDPDDLTDAGKQALKENVDSYFNNTFWADIQNNVDQASFVNWYISAEIMAAYKQLSDICAYRADAADSKLFFGPLDGGEKAYANSTKHLMDMSDIDTEGSYNGMIFTAADYKVMANKLKALWKEAWFKEAVIEKWNTIYGANATTDLKAALNTKLTTLAQEIAQTMAYNYKPTAQGGAGWTLSGTYDEQVAAIRTYLDTRFAYLDKKFNELANTHDLLLGDVNGDGTLTLADLMTLSAYLLGNNPTPFYPDAADINNDGTIQPSDLMNLAKILREIGFGRIIVVSYCRDNRFFSYLCTTRTINQETTLSQWRLGECESQTMISVEALKVEFGVKPLFSDASFVVNDRDRIALVGKNGAGKSTMLKILCGQQQPTEGTVSIPNDTTIGYLPQVMRLADDTTVIDEARKAFADTTALKERIDRMNRQLAERTDYESDDYMQLVERFTQEHERYQLMGADNYEAEMERTLTGLGFERADFERPTSEFSGGWRMRIELAKILLAAARRAAARRAHQPPRHRVHTVAGAVPGTVGSAVVLVSHDRAFINNVTNRTLEISCGQIVDYRVKYDEYVNLRRERREQQLRAYENQQKEIADMRAFIERFRYQATKAVQVQQKIKQLEKIVPIEIDEVDNSAMHLKFPPCLRSGDYPVICDEVGKDYGDHRVFADVNLTIKRGEKVAFVGKNGEGKSTLVKCIMGEIPFDGQLKIGHNVQIGYFAQNQAQLLDEQLTVFETIDRVARGEIRLRINDILGAFMFGGEASDKKVKVLSGGERSRLAMIKLLLEPVNLLILDEPTNHLDMQSKDVLKEAIRAFDGTAIIVSHDREFLDGLVSKVYEFGGGHVREHLGGIYDFLRKKNIESLNELNTRNTTPPKADLAAENDSDTTAPPPAAPKRQSVREAEGTPTPHQTGRKGGEGE